MAIATVLTALVAAAAAVPDDPAVATAAIDVPTPTVTAASAGAGVPVLASTGFALADLGYEQSEHLISGTARAFTSATPLTTDGRWTVTPAQTAPYTTRVVVYRPARARDFNGTVLVEWLNVSGGVDAAPDWMQTHTQLVRSGAAWVGVSAQAGGANATKSSDPQRYAAMTHPGDSFSYDVFSQAGRAVRADPAVLGGLEPERVLAAGESQSAFRLVTYLNAVHPVAGVFDGFLVHSRGAGGAALAQDPLPAIPVPSPLAIRSDLDAPVFVYQAEGDVANANLGTRQPDTRRFRLWEGAGTAHYDTYGLTITGTDLGDGQAEVAALEAMQNPTREPRPGIIGCAAPINTGPMHYHLNAAIAHLDRWVGEGTPPPKFPVLEATASSPVVFAVDDAGNARGGVRSPHVDAPIATLGGSNNTGDGVSGFGRFCFLFGTTVPFTDEQLTERYPTRRAFVAAWNRAVDESLEAGALLAADGRALKRAAAGSDIGR
jgi:hypothetical protein